MKPNRIIFASLLFIPGAFSQAQIAGTQNPPRPEDHFQRQLIVNRVDFSEKINTPLVAVSDPSLYQKKEASLSNGIVSSLIAGLKEGKYLAYNPDNLTQVMTWDEALTRAKGYEDGSNYNYMDPMEEPSIDPFLEEPSEDPFTEDPSIDIEGDVNPTSSVEGFSLAPYETVFEFIENRIIDKNRSDVVHDIQYIRLVWVDPSGQIPDKNYICLKYSDVLAQLENTMCYNKENDAETRNMREIFELRQFTSFTTNISGRGVRTLPEAAFRRDQLTSFEHHLWSF